MLSVQCAVAVDWMRYLGTWYELASLPQAFERGCVGARAHYSLPYSGAAIQVRNTCYRSASDSAQTTDIRGEARVVGRGRLYVDFAQTYGAQHDADRALGNYWVLALGPGYVWAVVGSPDRSAAFVLARREALACTELWLEDALQALRCAHYDTTALQYRDTALYR